MTTATKMHPEHWRPLALRLKKEGKELTEIVKILRQKHAVSPRGLPITMGILSHFFYRPAGSQAGKRAAAPAPPTSEATVATIRAILRLEIMPKFKVRMIESCLGETP